MIDLRERPTKITRAAVMFPVASGVSAVLDRLGRRNPNCMRRRLARGCKHYFAFQAGTIRCLYLASMAINPEILCR